MSKPVNSPHNLYMHLALRAGDRSAAVCAWHVAQVRQQRIARRVERELLAIHATPRPLIVAAIREGRPLPRFEVIQKIPAPSQNTVPSTPAKTWGLLLGYCLESIRNWALRCWSRV